MKERVNLAQREIAIQQDTFYSNPDYAHDEADNAKLDSIKSALQQKQDVLADLQIQTHSPRWHRRHSFLCVQASTLIHFADSRTQPQSRGAAKAAPASSETYPFSAYCFVQVSVKTSPGGYVAMVRSSWYRPSPVMVPHKDKVMVVPSAVSAIVNDTLQSELTV